MDGKIHSFEVERGDGSDRIDALVSKRLPFLSRSRVQSLVRDGRVHVNEKTVKNSYRPKSGDRIQVWVPDAVPLEILPVDLPLDVLYEDENCLVINKPPGLVVHPAPGHRNDTLVNALLHHVSGLSGIGGVLRPGIVHRLDKDTSGALLVAKNDTSHLALSMLFREGRMRKTYLALVGGRLPSMEGVVDLPVGRHPTQRKKMSVVSKRGRRALTSYRVDRYYERTDVSLLEVRIHTGRTHQIRVHMAQLGTPVLGDALYGGGRRTEKLLVRSGIEVERQLLHASRLEWTDPIKGVDRCVEAPLPEDMASILEDLDGFEES